MPPYLVDTNILVDYFRSKREAAIYLDSIGEWSYSLMTAMELFAGARSKKDIDDIERFLKDYREIAVTEPVAAKARDIMKTYSKSNGIDPKDSFIAATAILSDFTLSTQNDKHFRGIDGLKLEKVRYPK